MAEKNRDFVTYMPSLDCRWIFTKETKADTITDTFDEFLSLCEAVFGASREILIPKKADFTLHSFESDIRSDRIFEVNPVAIERGEFRCEEGMNFGDLKSSITERADGMSSPVSLFEVEITSATSIISLADQEVRVSREVEGLYKWMYHGEPTTRKPSFDPITVGIYRRKEMESGDPIYKVIVDTHSDIWFEKTEIGEKNLRRLSQFLVNLDENIDSDEVNFHSEQYHAFESSIMPAEFLNDGF